MNAQPWSGRWVTDQLGAVLSGSPQLPALVGLALRDNPRRAQLLVSTVLGKHIPQRPQRVYQAGLDLGHRVRALLGERQSARAVVLGYAETATALGHSVADGLGAAAYLHSTRRRVSQVPVAGGFEEEHSHATEHLLLPQDPRLLAADGPLVLVDDEFSTGRTVANTITALHRRHPRERYVVAALVDVRGEADRARLEKFAAELGARVRVVALATGQLRLPEGSAERARQLVGALRTPPPEPAARYQATRVELGWPAGLPDGGRHGFTPAHRARLKAALPRMAGRIRAALPPDARRVLVLGYEELIYAPLRLAEALAQQAPQLDVRFSTTTRSPALALDDPGYAIRTRLVFPCHDAPSADGIGQQRYAYNVAGGGFDTIVAVVDSLGDSPALHAHGGLLSQLAAHTGRLLLGVIPSYCPPPADRSAAR